AGNLAFRGLTRARPFRPGRIPDSGRAGYRLLTNLTDHPHTRSQGVVRYGPWTDSAGLRAGLPHPRRTGGKAGRGPGLAGAVLPRTAAARRRRGQGRGDLEPWPLVRGHRRRGAVA